MIPSSLLKDMADRIGALADSDLLAGRDHLSQLAADPDPETRLTTDVMRAFAACFHAEIERREGRGPGLLDDPVPLAGLTRAIERLNDNSLDVGIVVHAATMSVPATARVAVFATLCAILSYERRERYRAYRRFERDTVSDIVTASWGDVGDQA